MIPSAFGFSMNYPEDPLAPPTPQRKPLTNSLDNPIIFGIIKTPKQRIDTLDKRIALLTSRMTDIEDKLKREENRINLLVEENESNMG